MKSEISATASGWLSLTPRSSRRRATIAAMAINNLSFSRGVRFMSATLASIEPEPRQPPAADGGENISQVVAERRPVGRHQAHDRESVPGGSPDLAAALPA